MNSPRTTPFVKQAVDEFSPLRPAPPDEKLTTAGAVLLKHTLPSASAKAAYDIYRPLDKDGIAEVVRSLMKDGSKESIQHINTLGKLFFNKASEIGASTPLSDYINNSDERSAIIQEYSMKVHDIMSQNHDKATQSAKLGELTGQYNKKIEEQNIDYLYQRGSTAAKMARTGARGNKSQLASGTSTPLMASNVKGELIPIVIEHSYAQGMRPAEHLALSYMGRGSTVLTQLSTALPGALFKRLSPTLFHEVITDVDCGTKNGILIPVSDGKSLLGRYLADTNQLVTERVYSDLKMSNVKQVKARSVTTCESPDGVCQHCFGLMANSRLPDIGTNIGVIAAQSVSEVLTQSMLSTKHKTTVGERKGNSYEQAANILNNPAANFKDEATMAEVNGIVSDITKTVTRDYHVKVGDKVHFVSNKQQVLVQVGDHVRAGQALSTGVRNPRKLVSLRGLGDGRHYVQNELRDIYKGGLDPRHFEVISKNLLRYVSVVDPGETHFVPGENVDIKSIIPSLMASSKQVPVDAAVGGLLAKGVLHLTPGTILDQNHIEDLKKGGVGSVILSSSKLRVAPKVPGLQSVKMLDRNWVSRLSFAKLRDALKESTVTGAVSKIHSTDPIASYMMGSEFGEGVKGQY